MDDGRRTDNGGGRATDSAWMAGRAATGRHGRDAAATGRMQLGKGRIWPEEPAAAAMAEKIGRGRDWRRADGNEDEDGRCRGRPNGWRPRRARTEAPADPRRAETTAAAARWIYKGMGLGGGRTGVVAAPGGKASRDGAAADEGGGAGSAT